MMKNKKILHLSNNVKIGIMILLGGLLLYGFFFWLPTMLPFLLEEAFNIEKKDVLGQYGQMGDSYGIFNALFSCLAFFGVLLTIYFQSRDNKKVSIR